MALGTYEADRKTESPLPCDAELRRWHTTYSPTFKPSFEAESERIIRNHLAPFFGSADLRKIREEDLLGYIQSKLSSGLAPLTIQTHLSILRRVLSLAVRNGHISRNPAARLGELMRRVGRRTASETAEVDSWTHEEIQTLLKTARQHEARLYPALVFLFSTGVRRGELLGLKWEDVDLDRRRIHIRRALVRGSLTTPKSGKGRYVAMTPGLSSPLFDLLAERRIGAMQRGWLQVPEWVFPNQAGRPLDEDNFDRSWRRRGVSVAGPRSWGCTTEAPLHSSHVGK